MITEIPEDEVISTITGNGKASESPPADYEKAILVTGYGLFNVLIFMAALPIGWAAAFDTATLGFIIASAECDLQLTFVRKGVLLAFPFIATVATSSLWDYVTIYVGRRTLFVLGLLADSVLNILSTAVDSYHVFLLVKFISGIIAGGPFSMVMGYLTEFHSARYKARFATWSGLLFSAATIVPAALGFIILPLHMNVDVFGKSYNSWRIYLLICSIPSILGIVTASMLPESPKYLMQIGRNDLALRLFRRMYCMNTRRPADTFPIKALLVQKAQLPRLALKATLEKIRVDLYNTKLLFSAPYLPAFCRLTFLQFGSMLGFNVMRLWVPHLFIILNNYDYERSLPADRSPTICEMLDRRAAKPARPYLNCTNFDDACFEWIINPAIYINSTIIASSAVLFGFLVGFVMTTTFRKNLILVAAFLISVLSSFGINWAQAPPYMLTLAAAVIVTSRIAGNVVTAVNAEVIPIPLRATSVSIMTTIGNLAALIGNVIFSALLDFQCLAGFFGMGCLFLACIVATLVLTKPARTSPQGLAQQSLAQQRLGAKTHL